MRYLTFIVTFFFMASCLTYEPVLVNEDLEGLWTFEGYRDPGSNSSIFKGCGSSDSTVSFAVKRVGEKYEVTGKSYINTYSAPLVFTSFSKVAGEGTLQFGAVTRTEIGGSQEIMLCENNYFQKLEASTEYILESNKLYLRSLPSDFDSREPLLMVFIKQL